MTITIVEYDPETQQVTFPNDPEGGGAAIQHVRIIEEDANLLKRFFQTVHLHMLGGTYGEAANLEDIVVN